MLSGGRRGRRFPLLDFVLARMLLSDVYETEHNQTIEQKTVSETLGRGDCCISYSWHPLAIGHAGVGSFRRKGAAV